MNSKCSFRSYIMAVLMLGSLMLSPSLFAQGTKADYERANNLRKNLSGKVLKSAVRPNWFAGNDKFWYRNALSNDKHEFILVDAVEGQRQEAFDHQRLAEVLSDELDTAINPEQLPFKNIRFDDSGDTIYFNVNGKAWSCNLQSYVLQPHGRMDDDAGTLTPLHTRRNSGSSDRNTTIAFVNKTDVEIKYYWIDTHGQQQLYGALKPDGRFQQHTYVGHVWMVTDKLESRQVYYLATEESGVAVIKDKDLEEKTRPRPRPQQNSRANGQSPDGQWTAFIQDHNLFVKNNKTDEETALSTNATADNYYQSRFYWSPDSRKLLVLQEEKGYDRKVYLIESSPDDQLQPKLHSLDYRKPGDKIDHPRPRLFDMTNMEQIPVDDKLFPTPWSISDLRWMPDSRRFTFLYNQRDHQVLRILGIDADTGKADPIIDEQSETFIDYAGKMFREYLNETGEIIWMSERDGWNHLYLHDMTNGRVKHQITKGKWVVRRVEEVNRDKRQIWFWAGGIHSGQDPYYRHFCRVNFDGSGLTVLTEGNGTHDVSFSPDRRFFLDTWSRIDLPPVTELRDAETGRLICHLENADWQSLLETGWRPPERFVAKGRDGKTDIYGIIIRPTNFDPHKTYPVIEEIYAGPQGAFVPKSFRIQWRMHSIAELGFILVKMDGMGTSHRSKAFHDICWKNLGDSGFPDRILWMKSAAEKYPYMDLSRVGIYGGSAGGQSTLRGLLAHGDFYKVGVADCGCHDNRIDKIWWNELWMGWPIGPHYKEQSNVTQAHRLRGKLLLTVGEMDRNVDPASTLQVVDALIKADKDFDMLLVPGGGHGVGERPYAARRRMDFFVRHLLGVEPRH